MSSSFLSRSSMVKQRGAEMSSRLMPPKTGEIAFTIFTISFGSLVARQMGKASTPASSLKRRALPSITGRAARGAGAPGRGGAGEEGAVRDVDDLDPGDRAQAIDDLRAGLVSAGLEGDIPRDGIPPHLDQVDGPDVAAGLADGGGDFPEHPRAVHDIEPYGHAIAGTGGADHGAVLLLER